MYELRKNTARSYSRFDCMRTEELKELLRQDSMLPEGEASDADAVLHIAELIAAREWERSGRGFDADAGWKSFCENYRPQADSDDTEIIVYTAKGVEHYIIYNVISLTAVWFRESFECSITGNSAIDEMKRMIDAVYQ